MCGRASPTATQKPTSSMPGWSLNPAGVDPPATHVLRPCGNRPIGYALAQDNPLGPQPPPQTAGAWTPLRTTWPARNSSSFPGFGFDRDPRRPGTGYVALHTGSYAALYDGGRDFWNQTFPAGLRWNATPGATSHGFRLGVFNATGWPRAPRNPKPWLHAMHQSEWGNHVWEVDGVDPTNRTFQLGAPPTHLLRTA